MNADERRATGESIAQLQSATGGFAWSSGAEPDLAATSVALRALSDARASASDRSACEAFMAACRQPDGPGFSMTPGGPVALDATALGHVALVVLGSPHDVATASLRELVDAQVRTADHAVIAAAFLDTVGVAPLDPERLRQLLLEDRDQDGTWDGQQGRVMTTAMRASSLALLADPPQSLHGAARMLLDARTPEGGWLDAEGHSSLRASYQVVRALRALSEPLPRAGLNAQVAACRHSDSAYSVTPDDARGDLMGSYLALSIDRWTNHPEQEGIN